MKKFIFCIILVSGSMLHAAKNPHGTIRFDCNECHTVESFTKVAFDHAKTGYELEGRHNSPNCKGCHDITAFSKVSTDCATCHLDVHEEKLGGDCVKCHTLNGWEKFDIQEIHLATTFPFSGRHSLVDCLSCHNGLPNGDMATNTANCEGCHQSDYLSVTDPDHAGSGFSTDCESCHTMERWKPALFENHDILFPIFTGTHNRQWDNCSSCHTVPNQYNQFNCLTCHEHNQTDMDGKHGSLTGYAYESQSCYFCHPTGEAGNFTDHDAQFFPIYSGKHVNTWDDCNACHTNASNRAEVNCLECHDHNQTDTDIIHGGMSGYSYVTSACLTCHPTGEKGLFVDHDPEFFPIFSGTHNNQWDNCTACHANPADRSDYTCLSCHDHNQTDMDNMHGGMTDYAYLSTACLSCHPTGQKGQFTAHDAQFFPIYSGRHNNTWSDCNICHTVPTTRSVFSCLECHEHSQALMDDKHLGEVNGYSYSSDACLDCHPTGRKE